MSTSNDEISIDESYEFESDSDWEANSARTLASTIDTYRFENGRRYHAYREGQYWAPNDAQNSLYEGILHHLVTVTLRDKLYLAPIEKPKRVIDVGTGTGLWALDFADQNEQAIIVGTDLSPIQESSRPNLTFEIDDCSREWTYPPDSFDFVHVRCLYGSIKEWDRFYQECYSHMQPGGYIEQFEISLIPQSDDGTHLKPIWQKWPQCAAEAGRISGQSFYIFDKMKHMLEEAGFVDVEEKKYRWPVGPWPKDDRLKELGKFHRMLWLEGCEGWILAAATRYLGWTRQEVNDFLEETRQELHDRTNHVYYDVHVVYGRKPLQ